MFSQANVPIVQEKENAESLLRPRLPGKKGKPTSIRLQSKHEMNSLAKTRNCKSLQCSFCNEVGVDISVDEVDDIFEHYEVRTVRNWLKSRRGPKVLISKLKTN